MTKDTRNLRWKSLLLLLTSISLAIPSVADAATLQNTGSYGRYATQMPREGSPKALVVLVEFKDKQFSMEDPHGYYKGLLKASGTRDDGASASVTEWFRHNSGGVFTPDFDLYGPVTLPKELAYYGGNNKMGRDLHPDEMVIDACRLLDDSVDFSQYDNDGDGELDNVFIYYAGYGEVDSEIEDTVWPHSGEILDLRKGERFIFDDTSLNRYACTSEMDAYNQKVAGMGVFIHEFSHVLGLPDLYHTEYQYAFTPDSWSVMDKGANNDKGNTPCNYSSFELFALGWLEPEVLDESGFHELPMLDGPGKAYVIPTADPNELFFLENRQKEGNDAFLPGHGMLVWHVDFNRNLWDTNTVNNDASYQRVDIVEADGLQSNSTRNGDTFPGRKKIIEFASWTTPALRDWSGNSPGVDITEIVESDDGMIAFTAACENSGLSGMSTISEGSLSIHGTQIFNNSKRNCIVYDIAGRTVAVIGAGESVDLTRHGIYIARINSSTMKINL